MHKPFVVAMVGVLFLAVSTHAADFDAAKVTEARKKAAAYLLSQQNADGSFGKNKQLQMPGVSGLVIEALAQSPEALRENNAGVAKAVQYLLSKQQESGAIALPELGLENYNTSVALIGLAALENAAHKGAIEKAKKYLLSCQLGADNGFNEKEHPHLFGAFSYGAVKRGDLSNTAFTLEALKAAGLEENSPAWKNAVAFIKRCQDNEETNDLPAMKGGANSGGFVYSPGDSPFGTVNDRSGKKYLPRPYGNMTYEAVKSLIYAGVKPDDPALQAAAKWIRNNYSVETHPGAVRSEGYYYYVVAFAKAFAALGTNELELADGRKVHWAKDMAAHLASIQKADGSYANAEARWMESEPVLATAYALIALNVCAKAAGGK